MGYMIVIDYIEYDYVWMYDHLWKGKIPKVGLNGCQRFDDWLNQRQTSARRICSCNRLGQVIGKPSSRRRLAILQKCRGKQGQTLR